MKRSDNGDFCMLYIEPVDEKTALFQVISEQKKPVVLMLPLLPGQARSRLFQRPEDFSDLKHVKRQASIPLIFITSGSEHITQLAIRAGFPAYASIDALFTALSRGQISLGMRDGQPYVSRPKARTVPLHQPEIRNPGRKTIPLEPRLDYTTESSPEYAGADAIKRVPTNWAGEYASERVAAYPARTSRPLTGHLPERTTRNTPPSLPPAVRTVPLPAPSKPRRGLMPVLLILTLLLLGGIGAGSFLVFYRFPAPAAPVPPHLVGSIAFLNSELVNQNTNQGIDDELQITLHNVPDPSSGKSYYAWLLSDRSRGEATAVSLGKLSVVNGTINMLYPGDPQHSNLLAANSRFLVTEEDSAITPITPTPDYNAWRFYAAIPATPDTRDPNHYSFLDHLRHLLASDPMLNDMELPGGLNNWFYRNSGKLLEWTTSARDNWQQSQNWSFIRLQAVNTLSYLDGMSFLQPDIPANLMTMAPEDAHLAGIGLLTVQGQNQNPPGYLDSIVYHLSGIVEAPGSTPQVRNEAAAIIDALSNVETWLQKVRGDAKKLLSLNDAQMAQPSTLALLDDVVTQVTNAYSGSTDTTTGQMRQGVMWIHQHLQMLATLSVSTYVPGVSPPEIVPNTQPVPAAILRLFEVLP